MPHLGDAQTHHRRGHGRRVSRCAARGGLPATEFTLIDGTQKKIRFVAEAIAALDIRNAHAIAARAERYAGEKNFDVVVVRAVGTLVDILHNAGHLLAPEGRLLAMKGKSSRRRAPRGAARLARRSFRAAVPGLDAERHLVAISRQQRPAELAGKSGHARAAGGVRSPP